MNNVIDPSEKNEQGTNKKGMLEKLLNDDDFNLSKAVDIVNKRIAFLKQVKQLSLAMTDNSDWTNQSGNPYLGGSGAEKLKAIWGIYIKEVQIEQIPDGGGFIFQCKGIVGSKVTGEESEYIGGRNSNDTFFTGADNQKTVDLMDVRKAAFTNFEVNGILRLLGLRNLTWEDLNVGGLNEDKITKIKYGKGSQGGQIKGDEETEKQREEIRNMLLEMEHGDIDMATKLLIEYSSWKDHKGKKNVKDLTVKQVPVIYRKVKKDYDKSPESKGETIQPDLQNNNINNMKGS